MRIYEGSARQDFEEVFRSIGAFLDHRAMKEVLLVEAPDGFIVQGLVTSSGDAGTWSDSMGTQAKETLTFLDDDIGRFMDEAIARRKAAGPMTAEAGRDAASAEWAKAGYYETLVPGARPVHGRAAACGTCSSSSRTARSSSGSS